MTRRADDHASEAERRLFGRLWEEVDFDDHPLHGGHGPEPEGELVVTSQPHRIALSDSRVRFYLYDDVNLALVDRQQGVLHIETDADERPASIHLLSAAPLQATWPPGRLGLHRWSLSPAELASTDALDLLDESLDFDDDVDEEDEYAALIGRPDLSDHPTLRPDLPVGVWRMLLASLRNSVEPMLAGWTWHLEVDNKPDRTGWYVRAPAGMNSLFTLFIGLGWQPGTDQEEIRAHTLLLFERAPPGCIGRPDERAPNRADEQRVERLCAGGGPLGELCDEADWAAAMSDGESTPTRFPHPLGSGIIEVWPPGMGRWPLLVARSEVVEPDPAAWMRILIDALRPSLALLVEPIVETGTARLVEPAVESVTDRGP